jgi:hypothetical protein
LAAAPAIRLVPALLSNDPLTRVVSPRTHRSDEWRPSGPSHPILIAHGCRNWVCTLLAALLRNSNPPSNFRLGCTGQFDGLPKSGANFNITKRLINDEDAITIDIDQNISLTLNSFVTYNGLSKQTIEPGKRSAL